MDVLQEGRDFVVGQVSRAFLDLLRRRKIFQARTGRFGEPAGPYVDRLRLGERIVIRKSAVIEPYVTLAAGNEFYGCGSFASIASALPLTSEVGRYVSIAEGVQMTGIRHPVEAVIMSSASFNPGRESISAYLDDQMAAHGSRPAFHPVPAPQPQAAPIKIGHDVWIGSDVLLNGGLTIGHGAVVAARAVVTKDVPPYTIVGGSPARVLRPRFAPDIAEGLAASSWWDYELADLHTLPLADPAAFLREFETAKAHMRRYKPNDVPLWRQIAEELLPKRTAAPYKITISTSSG